MNTPKSILVDQKQKNETPVPVFQSLGGKKSADQLKKEEEYIRRSIERDRLANLG